MNDKLLNHYKETGRFTYAGLYEPYFKTLPDDITELGNLVCAQVIHRITLKQGNSWANADLRYGDMTRYPWHRMRCEDDVFLTAAAMTAELFRLDGRGFVLDRAVENKLVLCCRYVSVLMTAILKAKGYAARSRAGYAPYIVSGISMDHWITQYYVESQTNGLRLTLTDFSKKESFLLTANTISQKSTLISPPRPGLTFGKAKRTEANLSTRMDWVQIHSKLLRFMSFMI